MLAIEINKSLCTKCGACRDICCNSRVITMDSDGYPVYKYIHKCISCGHCIAICAKNAITAKNTAAGNSNNFITDVKPLGKHTFKPDQIHDLLAGIRSDRSFTPKPVEKEKLEQILEVMIQSASAGNEQNRNYYIFTNPRDIQSIEEDIQKLNQKQASLLKNPLVRKTMTKSLEKNCSAVYKENGITLSKEDTADCISQIFTSITDKDADFFLKKAPVLIIVTYDAAKKGMHENFYKTDIGIALTNGIILAHVMGLSNCRFGLAEIFLNKSKETKAKYGIPGNEKIGGVLGLGYSETDWKRIPPRGPAKVMWKR